MSIRLLLFMASISLLSLGCASEQSRSTDSSMEEESPAATSTHHQSEASRALTEDWINFVNNPTDTGESIYAPNAILVLPDGTLLTKYEEIVEYWRTGRSPVKDANIDTLILAHEEKAISYAILHYSQADKAYQSLVVLQKQEEKVVRLFEYSQPVEETSNVHDLIEHRRLQWMALCNEHDVSALVNEMYSANTIYYNIKPVVVGREALIEEYSYMARPAYSLRLQPIFFKPVNTEFVFEIGQCSGSYGGKYILIWRKDQDEQWRVYIDANI